MNVDQENTFRALQDKDLIVTSWLCRWGFHKWTKWNNDQQYKDLYGAKFVIQRRHCVHCNDFDEHRKRML